MEVTGIAAFGFCTSFENEYSTKQVFSLVQMDGWKISYASVAFLIGAKYLYAGLQVSSRGVGCVFKICSNFRFINGLCVYMLDVNKTTVTQRIYFGVSAKIN